MLRTTSQIQVPGPAIANGFDWETPVKGRQIALPINYPLLFKAVLGRRADEVLRPVPPRRFTLEQALEYFNEDEQVWN